MPITSPLPRSYNGTAKVYMNKADKEYTENWQSWEPIAGFLALNGFPTMDVGSREPAWKQLTDHNGHKPRHRPVAGSTSWLSRPR